MFCVKKQNISYRDFTTNFFGKSGKYQNEHLKIMMANLLHEDENRKNMESIPTITDIEFTKPFLMYKSLDKKDDNEFMNYVVNPFSIVGDIISKSPGRTRNNEIPIINYG